MNIKKHIPTSRKDFQTISSTLKEVFFSDWKYIVLFSLVFLFTMLIFTFFQNLSFLYNVVIFGNLEAINKLVIVLNMLPFLSGAISPLNSILILLISFIFSLNICLSIDFFRQSKSGVKEASASLMGGVVGGLGIGCAACGSVLLASLLSFFGISSIAFLPLDGASVSFFSLFLLIIGLHKISQNFYR